MTSTFFEGEALTPTENLQKALFEEYGPADKRIKKIHKATTFRVDGCEIHTGADGNPLSHVCTIYVHVENEGRLRVSLSGNVPLEEPVQEWIRAVGSTLGDSLKTSLGLSFSLQSGDQGKLKALGEAVSSIVAPGRRYSNPSFKYTCPRTARALKKLQGVLDKVWK